VSVTRVGFQSRQKLFIYVVVKLGRASATGTADVLPP
jgi:hypothetical protein